MIVGKDTARLGQREIRYGAAPDGAVRTVIADFRVDRRGGVNEGVLPQVDVKPVLAEIAEHGIRIGIQLPVEDIRAGVGLILPSGFQPQNVAGDVVAAEIVGHCADFFAGIAGIASVKDTERPCGDGTAAAGEHIVLRDDAGDGCILYHIEIDAACGGDEDGKDILPIAFVDTAVEFRLTRRIDIYPPSGIGDKEGDGSVTVAAVRHRVCIDPERELASGMVDSLELETEAEELRSLFYGDFQQRTAWSMAEADGTGVESDIGFGIMEPGAETAGHEELGGAEGELFHGRVPLLCQIGTGRWTWYDR